MGNRRLHRWMVVIDDLPPMPARREVFGRWWLRRTAENEARLLRISQNRNIARGLIAVRVLPSRAGGWRHSGRPGDTRSGT